MLNKKIVDDLKDLQGKEALIRRDFSVPLREGVIQNYDRIDGAIPTMKKLLDQGAKVILCPYLGKPKGEPVPEMSLVPVAPVLSERLGIEVRFMDDPKVTGSRIRKVAAELEDGEVLLLQSIRYRIEETRFRDDDAASKAYTKELADLCDGIFVNDAFGTTHRAYCSNISAIRSTKENVAGYLMKKETRFLGQVAEDPARPFVAILDGAKVSDKINVINNLLDKVDTLIIGGGVAYTFVKTQDQKVGNSLCEADKPDYALGMIKKAEEKGAKLLLPADRAEGREFSNDTEHKTVDVIDIGRPEFDIGPKATALYKETLQGAETAMQNGPMGVFELSNFTEGTLEAYRAVTELADTTTVTGGGNSVNAVKKLGLADRTTHISTGGGVSLEFLEGKELPGVATAGNKA